MDLKQVRQEIDRIDDALLNLYLQRMQMVVDVARYKKENDLPILHTNREEEILSRMTEAAPDSLKEYVHALYTHLMESSKCYQISLLRQKDPFFYLTAAPDKAPASLRIACQGIEGAYQHIAAKKVFPDSQILFCPTFSDVFAAVERGDADYGVVPMENSFAGTVCDVYDLLSCHDLYIHQIYKLKIEHCLAAKQDVPLSSLEGVYSHQQALEQCSYFLKQNQSIPVHMYPNTAMAASFVSQSEDCIAAICSEESAKLYGLQVLQHQIQNTDQNFTKFIILSPHLISGEQCNELSICIHLPHRSGTLNQMLTKFSMYHINLTKIESRPIGDKDFNVRFYIHFEGNLAQKNVQTLLHDLQVNFPDFKLLGSYPT